MPEETTEVAPVFKTLPVGTDDVSRLQDEGKIVMDTVDGTTVVIDMTMDPEFDE